MTESEMLHEAVRLLRKSNTAVAKLADITYSDLAANLGEDIPAFLATYDARQAAPKCLGHGTSSCLCPGIGAPQVKLNRHHPTDCPTPCDNGFCDLCVTP